MVGKLGREKPMNYPAAERTVYQKRF